MSYMSLTKKKMLFLILTRTLKTPVSHTLINNTIFFTLRKSDTDTK